MAAFLSGVRVADFSHLLPGPFCARRLQLLGAKVVKIELPHWRDPARREAALFKALHAGQRRLVLDFSSEEGRRELDLLLGRTDVLIEGFRPGLMDRLGLGEAALRRRFPRLIYCSITGRGRRGPRVSGHDLNYQALAGSLGRPPRRPSVPVADLAAAWDAASRIAAALYRRERTGRGAFIDVSMVEAARAASVGGLGDRLGRHPFYSLYETKDGGWLSVAALEPRYSQELLRQVGRPDLAKLDPVRHEAKLRAALGKLFRSRSLSAWTRLLSSKEVCVQPVLAP